MNRFQHCRAGMTRGEFLKLALCSGAFAAAHPLRAVAETLASGNPNWMGTDPTERAFYRAFRDFNPLNDLGSG